MKYKVRKFQNPSSTLQYFADLNAEVQAKNNSPEERIWRTTGWSKEQEKQEEHNTPGLRTDRNGVVSVDYENQGDYVPTTTHKIGTALQDTGTRLLHGVQTLGSSIVGDAIKGFSPSAANWLERNTFGVISQTPQEKLNRNRQGNWNSRITDAANSVSTAVGFGSLGGVGRAAIGTRAGQGLLGSKVGQTITRQGTRFMPKNTNFLVNRDGFNMPRIGKIADAGQPSPLMDRVGMAELEAKRQLSRGKRKVQGAAERVKQPVRDYKDYKKGLKIKDRIESGDIEPNIGWHKRHIDLLNLRLENIGRMEWKYRNQSSAFHDAKRQMAKKEKSYKFWDDVFKPKKVETDTKWLNTPITEQTFKRYANTPEMQRMAPYMHFTEFTNSPNNKFVGNKWGYSNFNELDWAVRNNKVAPPNSLRSEYKRWADNLNRNLSKNYGENVQVGGSSLNFIGGHTKTLPGDIDRYVLGKNPAEKFVEWRGKDGSMYKFGNLNFSGNKSQPGIAQVHMAYQNPKNLHSLNVENAQNILSGKAVNPKYPVNPNKIDMNRSTLTDLFISSKDKHSDRLHEVASKVSESELLDAFNTKVSGMSSQEIKFPKFTTNNKRENIAFLRKVAPELRNEELKMLAGNEAKMNVLLKNYYLDNTVGTRYLTPYENSVPKSLPLEERFKRIMHSTNSTGGQAYRRGKEVPDVYYAKGNKSTSYGPLNITSKAELNLPENPSPMQLLDNTSNFKDGVFLHKGEIMTFPYQPEAGYGVGQPLSYGGGTVSAFPPRIFRESRKATGKIKPTTVDRPTVNPKHIDRLKASLERRFPEGIPEDKENLYNMLANYEGVLKSEKLKGSLDGDWAEKALLKFPDYPFQMASTSTSTILPDWKNSLEATQRRMELLKLVGQSAGIVTVGTPGVVGAHHIASPYIQKFSENRKVRKEQHKKWVEEQNKKWSEKTPEEREALNNKRNRMGR